MAKSVSRPVLSSVLLPLLLLLAVGSLVAVSGGSNCSPCNGLANVSDQQKCISLCQSCKSCGFWFMRNGVTATFGCNLCAALVPWWGWLLLSIGGLMLLGGLVALFICCGCCFCCF